jgi:hypothetical protein
MSRKSEEPEDFMRRLAGGLVSWLTFQQVALKSEMYSERFVYTPIFELATARGWRAEHEVTFKLESQSKRLDFVFSNGRKKFSMEDRVAALEIKLIPKKIKSTTIEKIICDEERLKKFNGNEFHRGIHASVDRYIMLIAKKKNLISLCDKAEKIRESVIGESVLGEGSLMRRVRTIMKSCENKNHEGQPFGEIFYSSFEYKALWCVMILFIPAD